MASDTDTVEIILVTAAELRWLGYAARNVQARTAGESAMRQALAVQFDKMLEENPRMFEFVLTLAPDQAALLMWAVAEGRCRDGDERHIRGRMQHRFNEVTGGHWGINAE